MPNQTSPQLEELLKQSGSLKSGELLKMQAQLERLVAQAQQRELKEAELAEAEQELASLEPEISELEQKLAENQALVDSALSTRQNLQITLAGLLEQKG